MMRLLLPGRSPSVSSGPPPEDPRAFHLTLGAAPTPLLDQPDLAANLGVGHVYVKLESNRIGLPSFKIMGASWATMVALGPMLPAHWKPHDGLASLAGELPDLTLVAASEGNHGQAVARMARLLGLRSRIFVPSDMAEARITVIEAEGADVVLVDGYYDDAVERSAVESGRRDHLLVSDTSWPGYERVPGAVIDGYSTILWEAEQQLSTQGQWTPDLVLVPMGVGALGAAVIRHVRHRAPQARVVGVEPTAAASVMASLAAGRRLTVPGPHVSVMAGLCCGTPSYVAWPLLRDGLDATVAIDDDVALEGIDMLAAHGVAVGQCSGAGVGAAHELLAGSRSELYRSLLGLPDDASVLLFATEGVTDGGAAATTATNDRNQTGRPADG